MSEHWDLIFYILQEAQAYAEENSLLFMETSAKTAMNVNDIFLAIGDILFAVVSFIYFILRPFNVTNHFKTLVTK